MSKSEASTASSLPGNAADRLVEPGGPAPGEDTRAQFMAIVRRKLSERGYVGEQLEAKLAEITSKQNISFSIDWDAVISVRHPTP